MILTWLIAIPLAGGLISCIAARWSKPACRWIALASSIASFCVTLSLWVDRLHAPVGMITQQRLPWVPSLGISYHLSLDGLSLMLVLLTSTLGMFAVACSWREITDRVGTYHFALMTLLAAIYGVFLAYDLFLFYFFWELMLIPMYFLISIWGHEHGRAAALKFFLFTFIAGFFMLLGILGVYILHGRSTGVYTFDYLELLGTAMSHRYGMLLMLGFFVGLSVKLPVFPLHSWLPDAHTEAPTAGSVILAGLLLKTGAYGLMRFAVPLFPAASSTFATVAMTLGVIGIIYGALLAFPQRDVKRLVAYTSISHMGFVLLGIYAGTRLALQGAMMSIVAHGISTGALFLIVGMVQERTHTRDAFRLGGLWATTPKLGGFTMLFAMAALGLPGMANFTGEFLVLLGTFAKYPVMAMVGTLGLVMSVIYALRLVQTTVLGPNENDWVLSDLSAREIAILAPLAFLIIWLGVHPQPVFRTAEGPLSVVSSSLDSGQQPGGGR